MKKIKQKLRFLSFADLFSHHEDKQSCHVLGEHFTDGGSPWFLRNFPLLPSTQPQLNTEMPNALTVINK